MASSEEYSLQWSNYHSIVCDALCMSQQKQEFVDMTLSAEGHLVKVHQLIISLASPYLKQVILSTPCQHPVIHLNNVSYKTLCSLLEYIYTGHVTIPADIFPEFVTTAKSLHIKGLQQMVKEPNKDEESSVADDSTADELNASHFLNKITAKTSTAALRPVKRLLVSKPANAPEAITPKRVKSNDETDIRPDISEKIRSQEVQYTVSNRGALQMILNRFLYNSLAKTTQGSIARIRWQCVERRNHTCPAVAVTENGIVVNRSGMHNHEFHDRKILTKLDKNIVFSDLNQLQDKLLSDS